MEEALATLALSTEKRQNAMIEQLVNVQELQNKEQDTAFLLEFIAGILGFLGIGYIYSGLTNAGLIRLVGMWAVMSVTWSIAWLGVGSLILPSVAALFVLNMVLAYFSARDLKQSIFFAKAAQMVDEDDDDFIGYLESGSNEVPAPPFQKRNQSRNRR
jgi:hypothetical protein